MRFTTADYTATENPEATYTLTLDNADWNSFGVDSFAITTDDGTFYNDAAATFTKRNGGTKLTDVDGNEVKVDTKVVDTDEVEITLTGKMQRGWVFAVEMNSTMDKITKGKTATVTVDSDDVTITNGDDLVYASVEAKVSKHPLKTQLTLLQKKLLH